MGIRLQRGLHVAARLHRVLGLALAALFVTWFASGIAMVYYRPPLLDDAERLGFAAPLDATTTATTRVLPAAAVPPLAAAWPDVSDLRLARFGERWLYRWRTGDGWQAAWADDGTPARFDGHALAAEARRWLGDARSWRYVGEVDGDTQWTFFAGARPHLPLLRFATDGPLHRDVYFSSRTGEPVVATTPGSRLLYLLGPGLHYFSFAPLRSADSAWRTVVIVSSALGVLLCVIGLVLGIARLRLRRWWTGRARAIPYAAPALRRHHWSGLAFGVLGLTFVTSGLLSMNPGRMFPPTAVDARTEAAALGPPPPLEAYPAPVAAGPTRELHWHRRAGRPALVALVSLDERRVYLARGQAWQIEPPWSREAATAHAAAAVSATGASVLRTEWLARFDDHYYARKERHRPLPAVRVIASDGRWFYFDGVTGAPLSTTSPATRVRRWLYHGLHSFDVQWLLQRPRLWEATIWAVSLAGLAFATLAARLAFGGARRKPCRPGVML
ncbi:MAG: hypothetical protein ACK53C_00850 [Pseudomonadota bacterium]